MSTPPHSQESWLDGWEDVDLEPSAPPAPRTMAGPAVAGAVPKRAPRTTTRSSGAAPKRASRAASSSSGAAPSVRPPPGLPEPTEPESEEEPRELDPRLAFLWRRFVTGYIHLTRKRRHWGIQGAFLKETRNRAAAWRGIPEPRPVRPTILCMVPRHPPSAPQGPSPSTPPTVD